MYRFYTPKNCFFCTGNIKHIDYKDVRLLQKFLSPYGKIQSRSRTGICVKHQRVLAKAIKRARYLALLPFVSK